MAIILDSGQKNNTKINNRLIKKLLTMMKRILICCLLTPLQKLFNFGWSFQRSRFWIFFTFIGATVSTTVSVYSQTDLPKIIAPSPETSALFKYQDYPMDNSTGLPQISIPIYEVKSGSLNVPISITYHASGCKVTDRNGPIAVGWSLMAGGMVSRTIYNAPDFGTNVLNFPFPYPFKVTDITNAHDLAYLENIIHCDKNPELSTPGSWLDSEYDIFSYSFNKTGGKFIFKDENGLKTPVLLPYKPYVITPHSLNGLRSIDIIDDKGVFYSFTGVELWHGQINGVATSAFALKQMISADKVDTITFMYNTFTQERVSISQHIVLVDDPSDPAGLDQPEIQDFETTNRDQYDIPRLTEIRFSQGKVIFNLVNGGDHMISSMEIVNKKNEIVKTVEFTRSSLHSLSELGYATDKLDKLTFKDKTGKGIENYSFEYFPTVYPGSSTQLNVRYQDWWGYYNASGEHDMVPYYTNIEYKNPGIFYYRSLGNINARREPDLNALKSGVLKRISYPTGGSAEFTYENNRYLSLETHYITNGPGLRVAEIKTNDNAGNISTKTFKYGIKECGYGFIDLEPDLDKMKTQYYYQFYIVTADGHRGWYRQRIFYSGFVSELGELAQRPVEYPEVTVYNGVPAIEGNNIGKTIYNYDRINWAAAGVGPQKWHIYDWNYLDKTSLVKQTEYKINGNLGTASYQKKKVVINSYTTITSEFVYGLHVQRAHILPQDGPLVRDNGSNGIYGHYPESFAAQDPRENIQIYVNSEYRIPAGTKNLTTVTDTLYNDDGSKITNTTSYTYNTNQLVSQTKRSTSDGKVLDSQIKYPFDYTGNAVLAQMISPGINMINFPVEQYDFKDSQPIKSIRTNYFNWGSINPMLAPQTVDIKQGNGSYETRLHYYSYDNKGNPTCLSKENDVKYSYLWDYNKTYPVAEVVNATQNTIAFTSFEADGQGNWIGINTTNIKSDMVGVTGKKYYTLNGGSLAMTGLSSSDIYVISYWSTSGPCTVSGTTISGWPKNLKAVVKNGVNWSHWEHRVTGVTAINISGSISIDELRLYPENAQMTSYTYEPLVGVSSKTDSNNITGYYEYDDFGRLKLIRDFNGNILKMVNYNYQEK